MLHFIVLVVTLLVWFGITKGLVLFGDWIEEILGL